MAKTKVSEFDAVASNNTDINSVNVAEGCPPSGINNAIREMASLLKKQEVGTDAMTSPDINGGTIDGATIGGSSGVTIGVSDGTVSAPSIKFTSDTNTGIYRGGTDILKFVTAGTDAITIDASQNVTLASDLTVDGIAKIDEVNPRFRLLESDTTDLNTQIQSQSGVFKISSLNDAETVAIQRFTIGNSTGNISFYEDTGTTPKLFWDASAEVLTSNVGGYWRLQPSGSEASPAYSFEGDTDTGMFRPSGNANTVAISTGGTEAMRIDSSQNLLVGKTAEDIGTAGHAFASQGYAFHTRSGNTPLFINRLTNDGNLVEFRKDGTTVGSIGATSGVLTIDGEGANTGGFYFNGANNILPRKNKAFNSGTIDLGSTSQRWKDLYLSGDINLGDGHFIGDQTNDNLLIQSSGGENIEYNSGNGTHIFYNNGVEKFRIDNNDNVGIGTSSPASPIHISSNGDTVVTVQTTNATADGRINFRNSGGTDAGRIWYNTSGNRMMFYTNSTERMRIDSSGNLLINNTGASPLNSGRVRIYNNTAQDAVKTYQATSGTTCLWSRIDHTASYFAVFNYNGSTVGTITTNGSATAYNTSSDHRLKENVSYDFDATTRLKELKPARFNFIADTDDTTVDGFLAHEVQSVVPEAITGTHNEVDDDGNPVYQGIDQSKLVPLLVKTIQELEARIVALETA